MTGEDAKKAFNWRNILSHSSIHQNLEAFHISCTMGLVFSASFGTNLESVVSRLINLWISLTFSELCILAIALQFLGFASMPRWVSIKPKNFPPSTSNAHLSGLNLMPWLWRAWKTSRRSLICCSIESDLMTMYPHKIQHFGQACPWKCSPSVVGGWPQHF